MIHTHDKPPLLAAFTAAISSDSNTDIIHARKGGVTVLHIKGEGLAVSGAISTRIHELSHGRNRAQLTDKEAARIEKRVLRDRKRAISKMKRTAIKVLCE